MRNKHAKLSWQSKLLLTLFVLGVIVTSFPFPDSFYKNYPWVFAILIPLMFLVFLNDIASLFHSKSDVQKCNTDQGNEAQVGVEIETNGECQGIKPNSDEKYKTASPIVTPPSPPPPK